jgi:hypothetical protein
MAGNGTCTMLTEPSSPRIGPQEQHRPLIQMLNRFQGYSKIEIAGEGVDHSPWLTSSSTRDVEASPHASLQNYGDCHSSEMSELECHRIGHGLGIVLVLRCRRHAVMPFYIFPGEALLSFPQSPGRTFEA